MFCAYVLFATVCVCFMKIILQIGYGFSLFFSFMR